MLLALLVEALAPAASPRAGTDHERHRSRQTEGRRRREKSYIVLLLGNEAIDMQNALCMIRSLAFLQDDMRTTLLVFRESTQIVAAAAEASLREAAGRRPLRIEPVVFPPDPIGLRSRFVKRSRWGYHHMCNFFFQGIMDHPALRHARYYMRLDGDACLRDAMPDLFAAMDAQPGVDYIAHQDDDGVAFSEGLASLATSFAAKHAITLNESVTRSRPLGKDGATVASMKAYNNNFEVVRLASFQHSTVYRAWVAAVLADQGIYRGRWGDSALRRIGLNLMNGTVHMLSYYTAGRGTAPYLHAPHRDRTHAQCRSLRAPSRAA